MAPEASQVRTGRLTGALSFQLQLGLQQSLWRGNVQWSVLSTKLSRNGWGYGPVASGAAGAGLSGDASSDGEERDKGGEFVDHSRVFEDCRGDEWGIVE